MTLASPKDSGAAETNNITSSDASRETETDHTTNRAKDPAGTSTDDASSSGPEPSVISIEDFSIDYLNSLARDLERDTSSASDSCELIGKDPTVENLKALSREAEKIESDTTVKEPPEEIYEGFSSKADAKPAASSDSSRASKKERSGEYLESLSRSMLNVCLNLKDPEHPLVHKHQSVDFRNKHDALPKASNRGDHHENLAKHLAEQINFHVEIHNTSSEVDDSRGRGTVYLWYEITGLAHGLEREAVAVLSWERKQGTWMLMKHIGMRGPAGFC